MKRFLPALLTGLLWATVTGHAVAADPTAALAARAALKDNVQSLGPNGEKPVSASVVSLADGASHAGHRQDHEQPVLNSPSTSPSPSPSTESSE